MDSKKPWQSKTTWVALVIALAAFYPPAAEWMKSNGDVFGQLMAGVFFALRLISKDKISIG